MLFYYSRLFIPIRIRDLISGENRFITTGYFNKSGFHPLDVFEIMAIIDTIPCKWHDTIETISYVDK